MRVINLCIKRFVDLFGGLIGIIIISPIFIVIALLIKLTSKGPVFFRQERLGKDGKVFKIYKFRTMVENAETLGDGLMVKSESDKRITKVGRILRTSSMDELPQLINVILGDMSLVGPRPPVTYHPYKGFQNYPEWTKPRFDMRPGMTGLSQITVRNSVSWDERIRIDIKYIERFNIWLDFKILLKTVQKVFNRESIYANVDNNESAKVEVAATIDK
jgi:undecaprenyl phosphate N,N'-diacetylbacillosamine 1-phosphate transferase